MPAYKRILLKLSGEALMGDDAFGINRATIERMVAEIAEHRPAEFVSIRHLGVIHNGVEDTIGDAVRAWAPCFENYSFTDEAGGTRLRVDCDVFGSYEDWMNQTWPKALQALKNICETPT